MTEPDIVNRFSMDTTLILKKENKMTQLEIIETLQAGKIALKTNKETNSTFRYWLDHKLLKCQRNNTVEWTYTTFEFLFNKFEDYTYSIYEEKPKLVWEHCPKFCKAYAEKENIYYIVYYKNMQNDNLCLLSLHNPECTINGMLFTDKVFYLSLDQAQEAAQKHFEENS